MRHLFPTVALLATLLAQPSAAREVTDDTGRVVDLPEDPQRIVALHEPVLAVPLLELGLNVVGIHGRNAAGGSLMSVDFLQEILDRPADAQPIPGIGAVGNIDLEALRALKPDLIVGTDYDGANAEMMAPIAPVYLQDSTAESAHGFSVQEDLAGLLGRETEFDALKRSYRARLDRLRADHPERFPASPGDRTYLAVMVTDQLNVFGSMSGAVQALEDLGFRRAPLDKEGSLRESRSMLVVPLGPESFGQLDPDLLVVMNSFVQKDRSPEAIAAEMDRIVPGWQNFMKPAREGRVVYLDSARVSSPSVASAMHMLDALTDWAAN